MGSLKETFRARHGEVVIAAMDSPPDLTEFTEEKPGKDGDLIVGHSETGANHVVVSSKARLYRKAGHDIAVLLLPEDAPLRHDGHRHDTKMLKAGAHSISVKRQYNPDGSWSPVQD